MHFAERRRRSIKSESHIFEKIVDIENIDCAIGRASRGKRKRFDVELELLDRRGLARETSFLLEYDRFTVPVHEPVLIFDGIVRKQRYIIKPDFKYEQIVHHAMMQALKDTCMRGMYYYSCGSIPFRGGMVGKKGIERGIRKLKKDLGEGERLYFLKMDIRHFFQSIDQNVFLDWVRRKVHDARTVGLIRKIVKSYEDSENPGSGKGFPLGYYTSQWFANWILQPLDHFIKETLGAECYVRYMDDMVIVSKSKKRLHRFRREIEKMLNERFHLELKKNWKVDTVSNGIDFMGFRFFENRTTMRKSILKKARRKANRIGKKDRDGRPVTWYDACQMMSYFGWLDATDTYSYYTRYIKPHVRKKRMRFIVSAHQKRMNAEAKMLEMKQEKGRMGAKPGKGDVLCF